MKKLFYSVPVVRELPLRIERGFAASLDVPPGGSEGTDEEDWK